MTKSSYNINHNIERLLKEIVCITNYRERNINKLLDLEGYYSKTYKILYTIFLLHQMQ